MLVSARARCRTLWHAVYWPIEYVGLRLLTILSPRRDILGVELAAIGTDDASGMLFAKGERALHLISATSPARFARIRRDLRRLVLISSGGQFYHQTFRAHFVDLRFLQKASDVDLALSIVHEATHARLLNAGIRYDQALRARVEGICVGQELAFAERLSLPPEAVEQLRRKLDTPWWNGDALFERRVSHLRTSGVPPWAVRLLRRLFSESR